MHEKWITINQNHMVLGWLISLIRKKRWEIFSDLTKCNWLENTNKKKQYLLLKMYTKTCENRNLKNFEWKKHWTFAHHGPKNEFWKFHAWKYPQNTDKEGQSLYDDFQWSVIKDNVITAHFPMMTGVKQGCCMTGFLFLLDFAEDIDLLSLTMNP